MPIGFGFAHVVLSTPISTRRFSPFTFGAGNVCFSLLLLRGDGVIFSPCQIGRKTTKWASHRALLVYLGVLGGELLPAAPLQPCAEAPLGRGHIVTLLDWVNLAPGHYASHYARLEAPPRLVAEAPHPVVGPYRQWVLSTPCQYIPCPSFTPKLCVLSFIVHQSIKEKKKDC